MDDEPFAPMDQLQAHLDRGWDLVSRGDLAGAMLSAETSIELDEKSPDAHHLLGYIYAAEGRAEEALEEYQQALDLDEGFFDAMLNAAEVLIHPLGLHGEALKMIDEALDLADNDDEILDAGVMKIDALLSGGQREAAAALARRLPDGPYANAVRAFQVGRARFDVGEVESAEGALREAAGAPDAPADAHYYLGLILDAKGDKREAVVRFLQCREGDLASPRPPWAVSQAQFERRVQAALRKLDDKLTGWIEGALVVVSDLPGAEVVAEGVDPRLLALLDDLSEPGKPPRVGRIFVYQRNVERAAAGLLEVEGEVARAIREELEHNFREPAAAEA